MRHKSKYLVVMHLRFRGNRYNNGDFIYLTDEQAALVAPHRIEKVGSVSRKSQRDRQEAESEKLKAESPKWTGKKPQRDRQEASEQASTDHTAKEAIAMIASTPFEQLDGFVGEDETRKTVLAAWEQKQ
jgi:hypothetical protein